MAFEPGRHTIDSYGGENCCDEATTWSFSVNGGEW
jgi:hypothetical protein